MCFDLLNDTQRSFTITTSSGNVSSSEIRKNGGGWVADTDDTTVEYITVYNELFFT